MATHELKTWSEYFQQIKSGEKKFELRKNDRDYRVADTLILKEFIPKGYNQAMPHILEGEYTGEQVTVKVSYMFSGLPTGVPFGLSNGYCIMGIEPLSVTSNVEESIFGMADPFPLKDVLNRLANATEILLHNKNYDGSDYEELGICVKRAKEIAFVAGAGRRPVDAVELAKEVWAMTMAYANNLCIQLANAFNSDDEIEKATAASGCALNIRTEIDDPHPDVIEYAKKFQQPPATLSASIIEALEKANPWKDQRHESTSMELINKGYDSCLNRLRELTSSQPETNQIVTYDDLHSALSDAGINAEQTDGVIVAMKKLFKLKIPLCG